MNAKIRSNFNAIKILDVYVTYDVFVLFQLTLLACTQSVDNLFHTLMVLWENEYFLTSNLLCFFTGVQLCPLVILLSLISKKILESIFS